MAVITGLVAAGISAAGSYASAKQGADASSRNYRTRYQMTVKDLEKAGLNPMLAVSHGAPVPAQPNIPDYGESVKTGLSAYTAKQQNKVLQEQERLMRAQGNKEIAQGELADAQTKQINETLPFAAKDAAARVASLETSVDRMRLEMAGIETDNLRKMNDYEREKALAPLIVQYQEYLNKAAALGMSKAEADSKFYETLGAADKYGPGLKFILQVLERAVRK